MECSNKIIMNPQQCLNHPLNSSYSKYSYKFSKSRRFKTPKMYTHSMYSISQQKNKRTTNFGFGERSKIQRTKTVPSPDKYEIPSTITDNKKSFGIGRKEFKFCNFIYDAQNKKNPSPDRYNLPSSIKKRSITFGEKLPSYIDKAQKDRVPPPGSYNLDKVSVNLSGKFPISKIKNVRKIIFLGRQSFYEPSQKYNLGPGQCTYQSQNLDDTIKTASCAQLRKTTNSFGTSKRPHPADKSKKDFPGPGNYKSFSQFPDSTL